LSRNLTLIHEYIELDETIFSNALKYQKAGFKLFDALHLACAENKKNYFSHNG